MSTFLINAINNHTSDNSLYKAWASKASSREALLKNKTKVFI